MVADPAEIARLKPAITGSFFDMPTAIASPPAHATHINEEEEILAEVSEDRQFDENEDLDVVP